MQGGAPEPAAALPPSLVFIERDWLSSNHLVGLDPDGSDGSSNGSSSSSSSSSSQARSAVVVDTGYGSRSDLTVALVEHALGGAALTRIINTHAHSDHVGGNAALRARHDCRIQVPAGTAQALAEGDEARLHYASMGQVCRPFLADDTYGHGDWLSIGGLAWQALGSPGHDNDSLVLYQPEHRLLMSGDALWQKGFGLLFPVFYGEPAFEEQAATLDLIAGLDIALVLPGHGPMFSDAAAALAFARDRLAYLGSRPERHANLALKVALSFLLLDRRAMPVDSLADDFARLELIARINDQYFGQSAETLAASVRDALVKAGVARIADGMLVHAGPTG